MIFNKSPGLFHQWSGIGASSGACDKIFVERPLITPTGNGPGTRDNHGTISSLSNPLIFSGNTSDKSAWLRIGSAHAGDNYIVAAHPNAGVLPMARINASNNITVSGTSTGSGGSGGAPSGGGSNGAALPKTGVLTVWRTLWVERDQMTLPPLNIETADVPLIDGFVATEFARACIKIEEYKPNPRPTVAGVEFDDATTGSQWDSYRQKRDSPAPTPTFWTVLMVGAFRSRIRLGGHEDNTILIHSWAIQSNVEGWNVNNPNDPVDLSKAKRRSSLHELGHAFGLSHATSGVMLTGDTKLKTNPDLGECMLAINLAFTQDDLRTIQSKAKPE